jgi:8-oxo-dGTP pyrophosphatase MutT (NUDIX family)
MPPQVGHLDLKRGLDFIGVGCVFVCHDGQGRILMHKRSANCRDEQGRWDCGAGSMEFGETFEDCVRREVLEEYGAPCLGIKYVYTRNTLREHLGRPTHWIHVIHLVLVDPATVRINEPEKIDDIGWFNIDALPEPIHSGMASHLEQIKDFFART